MPQIFPMNWLFISSLILMMLIMIMIMTFFLKFFKNEKKMNNFLKKNQMILFKW
uniref:ATP synthase F0 subunit 8 n=1 Tax=Haemaphysalis montgomeryi TaxID=1429820 RepID=A0A8E5XNW9_9ACAR|nr:ATP synthase F0 subunit 8 [Haemaphysalis montgomeryi]QVJ97818.1 ATP synthase F0 subunit 8 [Haemaphysalis montgomeryi]WCD42537.1 ATP synthase F0 subunit 8 [Haemaphysalis montgomeryi]